MEEWASGLFDNFDEDKSGFLDFRELVICMSILSKGTFEERLRLCFDVYDSDKSGYLQRDELQKFMDSIIQLYTKVVAKESESDIAHKIH